jgi:hypothetical protein
MNKKLVEELKKLFVTRFTISPQNNSNRPNKTLVLIELSSQSILPFF